MADSRLGRHVTSKTGEEVVRAFVPPPLPPDPPLDLAPRYAAIDRANQCLGRLDGMSALLPSTSLFLYLYVQKEAVLSAQIEGTQSSLSDLLLFEAKQSLKVPLDDVEEVSNYVAAINHGLRRLKDNFPLSLRLIREIHAIMLRGGRGADKQPGEFRRSQNWIGGDRPARARFVPPPVPEMNEALNQFEKFLHDEDAKFPILVRAALAHVQFETIHPFLDGNGRVGRLLITLMLCNSMALHSPILYLSLYLKSHRDQYYDLLNRVRYEGAWEDWLDFFLSGVTEVAEQATDAAKRILALFDEDREVLKGVGRVASTALRAHEHFQRHPISTANRAADDTGLSYPTVAKAIHLMVDHSILTEITGRKRDCVYQYSRYMAVLSEGTEPIPD